MERHLMRIHELDRDSSQIPPQTVTRPGSRLRNLTILIGPLVYRIPPEFQVAYTRCFLL